MIERLRRVPDNARQYGCDLHFAEAHFGLAVSTLRELVDQGLPSASVDGDLRFEWGDLHYLGLRLGTARTYLWGLTCWGRSLERFARADKTAVKVSDVPQVPSGAGGVEGVLHFEKGRRHEITLRAGEAVAETRGTVVGQWPALPPDARQVAREIAESVSFYRLPASLRTNTRLLRRIGLADCLSAAPLIVEEWQAAGLEARVTHGLLISLPYSAPHAWPEVHNGKTWIPADPVTIRLMTQFGRLDESRWPPDRSNGPILLPLGEPRPHITAAVGSIDTILMTELL